MKFKHPDNGYTETVNHAWLWAFLFNWLYFAYKRAYLWAFVVCFSTILTFGMAGLVYPFFAKRIVRQAYMRQGWKLQTQKKGK